jgi:lipopolysaccharide/colanic/teichoic acid biosynthesis glycosyltransferase
MGEGMKPYLYIKRLLDILLALVLLIPALPVLAAACLAIKLETPGPVFFTQERPGYKGRAFRLFKLRTMIVETERDGRKLTGMERMTKSGRLIRKLSIDELPQILNILLGQMSFIGPRPLLTAYLPLYTKEQMRRHDVLPGISGWAQVNGRNEISWEQKFKRDVWYVEHVSFLLDLKIFLMTIRNVILRKGINAGIDRTMERFAGNGQSEENAWSQKEPERARSMS